MFIATPGQNGLSPELLQVEVEMVGDQPGSIRTPHLVCTGRRFGMNFPDGRGRRRFPEASSTDANGQQHAQQGNTLIS